MTVDGLIKVLQASIAPCVLISGAGLLLLSMTNRLSRPIDRIRLLCADSRKAPSDVRPIIREQIDILYRRCQFLRVAILLAGVSISFVSLIILMLFVSYTLDIQLVYLIEFSFLASLICLILSLVFFLTDVNLSLQSIKIEIKNI